MGNGYEKLNREELISELEKYKEVVDMFANTVLGGIARMSLKDMHLINATDGYYRMTGYTREESLKPPFSNCGMNLVVPEDIKGVEGAVGVLLYENKPIHIKYRIIKKDGSIVWNSAICAGVQEDEDGKFIDVFFLDITQEREQQRQNMLNEERFRIISEQTKDVIFEWDIEKDKIHYSAVYEKLFGPEPPPASIKELLERDLFHEDDKERVKQIIKELCGTLPYAEFKARLRTKDGSYYWALHRTKVIYNENSKPSHIVGIISNVNDFVEDALNLQHQAEHDSLTGLLNRSVAEKRIEQIILNSGPEDHHAFVQFDIDRFKQINDFMGHAAGDIALQKIAAQMHEMFRSGDMLIRMGGDEFAVFLTNFESYDRLIKRSAEFVDSVYHDFKFEGKIYPLSISLGVALYPSEGKSFQELYENADSALYCAKHGGGNRVEFFADCKNKFR